MTQIVLTNATIILEDDSLRGTVVVQDGVIRDIVYGKVVAAGAVDLDGDILMPGIIDLHTDNLERQVLPRPGARWPSRSAFLAHDAQCAVAGVTTVFDALCVGNLNFDNEDRIRTFQDGVTDLTALAETGLFKADHLLHLRCEMPATDMLRLAAPVLDHPLTRMVSLMDHTPGVGQYADLERFRQRRAVDGTSLAQVDAEIAELQAQRTRLRAPNRQALLELVRARNLVIASHDDETIEEIEANVADGIGISEFPVRLAAAKRAKALGMTVIAGAPNIVRGGSHSGNVSAADLIAADAVDALASDYVPPALLEAAFAIADSGVPLHRAIGFVTSGPARMARLDDRGRIAPGLRADLVQVRRVGSLAAAVAVWRQGQRVA
ncbi:alpha-D-ribose 1-methylphosphonate 5-triphosphate diphosphatase [Acidisoma cellulosilytica]|uniref:Alpha-D-ribose 1-methylphosphonate 5-triphosphate diphosphatase n=1 Tax=Acidisoma cellulosilyticum TaxID=2802395 RepID=A0A963Z0P9_9PROT|nr:alpha-D-ribose 1-methylphosphonate 5-triphosphate diphosphatase [Acidisoma cellulosilyticum]MCB8880555.1 alpha-D-ribose 1-methylphosphonate 5-triphosphate diphosphatase [Acidisoma cellulosilyticum]